MIKWHTLYAFSTLIILLLGGCADSEKADIPENFRETYIKLHDCKVSAHPESAYVVTWLSPNALPIWEAWGEGNNDVEFELGTTSVKAQYNDESCNALDSYTIMTKTSIEPDALDGGWKWGYANQDFECINCDSGNGCAQCHGGCNSGPTLFCTSP
jgi:hypothetical protein